MSYPAQMGGFTRPGRGSAAEAGRGVVRSGDAGRGPAQHTTIGHRPSAAGPPGPAPAARRPRQRQAGVDRRFAVVMLLEAATFGVASYLHLDGRIPLGFTTITGEHFSRASVPEAIIGAVLAAGAVVVGVAPGRARTATRISPASATGTRHIADVRDTRGAAHGSAQPFRRPQSCSRQW